MISRALAYLRGSVPARAMSRYGRDGSDAYDLVDTLPRGPARASAWNAYVCQTYADKLCGAGTVAPETARVVRALYDRAGTWLARAREGSDGGELVLPPWRTPVRSQRELAGMRDTLEALRTYVPSTSERGRTTTRGSPSSTGASPPSTPCGSRVRLPICGSASATR